MIILSKNPRSRSSKCRSNQEALRALPAEGIATPYPLWQRPQAAERETTPPPQQAPVALEDLEAANQLFLIAALDVGARGDHGFELPHRLLSRRIGLEPAGFG